MAKYYVTIGYSNSIETVPGVWEDSIVERSYKAQVLKNYVRNQSTSNVNDDININNRISITSDPYANTNFHMIKYATFMGTKWKVTDVEVKYPKLILSLGGVYNGN